MRAKDRDWILIPSNIKNIFLLFVLPLLLLLDFFRLYFAVSEPVFDVFMSDYFYVDDTVLN
jgi:hypothetical protein